MDEQAMLAEKAPHYQYEAEVTNIVDGDTLDVEMDLGFETFTTERIRLRHVDTAETYGTAENSKEHRRGEKHTEAVEGWVEEAQGQTEGDRVFVLFSQDYSRGGFGRIIGDLYSPYHEEWLTDFLLDTFDDIDYTG